MADEETQEDPSMSLSDEVSKQRLAIDEYIRMQAAFERVKEFPEFKPNERAHWLELRQAIEMYLRQWGKPAYHLAAGSIASQRRLGRLPHEERR